MFVFFFYKLDSWFWLKAHLGLYIYYYSAVVEINGFGTYLRIIDKDENVGEFFFDPLLTDLASIKNELNNSEDPVIKKYIYVEFKIV